MFSTGFFYERTETADRDITVDESRSELYFYHEEKYYLSAYISISGKISSLSVGS